MFDTRTNRFCKINSGVRNCLAQHSESNGAPYFLSCTRGIHSKKMTTIYTQESIQCLSIIGIYRRKSRFLWWKSNSFSFKTDLNEDSVDVSNCFFGFKIKCSLARKMTCDFAAWQSLFSCCKCILANVLSWDGVQFTRPVTFRLSFVLLYAARQFSRISDSKHWIACRQQLIEWKEKNVFL